MEKRVTVLLPNNRRHNVNVTANTTLLQILEIACEKHGYDSEEYCLKFHNKEVSLSQMFRFSGLPNNCILEMEQTERKRAVGKVIVCVQLEDGTREQSEFLPHTNVWCVLEQLCASQSTKYKSPVVIYMRTEIVGKERLRETTLKSLGILEGRAMLRFIDKHPSELKTQANVYKAPKEKPKIVVDDVEQPSTSRSAAASTNGGGGGGGFSITSNLVKSLKRNATENAKQTDETANEATKVVKSDENEPEKPKYDWGTGSGYSMHKPQEKSQFGENGGDDEMNGDSAPPAVNIIGPRQAVLFSLNDTKKEIDELHDSFFDLTVNDLKMVLRDLRNTSTGNEHQPLLTAKLRELERQKTMLNKLNQYKECVLRIQFPDRYVLQGIFKPHELFSKVEEFVREFLQQPNESFHLFTIPPKVIIRSEETLLELNFVPNAIVHFAYEVEPLLAEGQSYVQQKYLKQLTSEEGAHYAVQKYRLTRVNPK